MNNSSLKLLLDRLVGATVSIVLIAIGLNYAWRLIRPLIPVMVTVGCFAVVIVVVLKIVRSRRNGW